MCAAEDECQLVCVAIGYSFRYDFGHVIDGTRCERSEGDFVCVEGDCLVRFVVVLSPCDKKMRNVPSETDTVYLTHEFEGKCGLSEKIVYVHKKINRAYFVGVSAVCSGKVYVA